MKAPCILLFGLHGLYNYGCEAIVRGTETLLHERWPDARVLYSTTRPEEDRQRLAGVNLDVVVSKRHGKYSSRNILRKLLWSAALRWSPATFAFVKWCPRIHSISMIDGVDAVLSIGGDVYTLTKNGHCDAMPVMRFGDAVIARKKPYVLWGASVGPFGRAPLIERDVQTHLRRICLISAREGGTVDYLRALGVTDNVVRCADPAFAVAPQIVHRPSRNGVARIALNLSPVSVRYLGYDLESGIARQVAGLERLMGQVECKILLVPHVVSDRFERSDDLRYLHTISRSLSPSLRRRVELLEDDIGFVGTKKEIVKCDMIIAARMHCAINGLAATVPTILLSYSAKATGMAAYVYGCKDYVFPASEFGSAEMIQAVHRLLETREKVSSELKQRMRQVRADARRAVDSLASLLP